MGVDAIQVKLDELKSDYVRRNPESRAMWESARRYMPGGNTRSNLYYGPFPLLFDTGAGPILRDVDGNAYVDFLGEYTAGAYGHSHPKILQALTEVSRRGLNLGGPNRWEASFAQCLVERFPAIDTIRFTNSGTEANLMAIGAARNFTGRDKIIVFDGAYHGGNLTFTSGRGPVNAPFPFLVARYNDSDSVQALLAENAGEVAAVIIEPMLSSGGCIPASDAFLQAVRNLTEAAGALLIFDEVVTSRLGAHGVHGRLAFKPDLVTLGKYIGGGLGCGAFGGRADIMSRFDPSRPDSIAHAGTFNNNTLTMGVGFKALTEVFTGEVAEQVCARGEDLRRRLNLAARRPGLAMQFTGRGSSMNLHFSSGEVVRPTAETRGHAAEKQLYFFHMVSRGLYLAPRGMLNVCIAHDAADLDKAVTATEEFVDLYGELLSSEPQHGVAP